MARAQNPYAGQYAPSNAGLGKEEIVKGLKHAKSVLKFPNKHMSETGYKKGLKKQPESE